MAASPVKWTAEEFERMRALDRSLFVSAVFHLGHAARLGDKDAVDSMLRVLPLSRAEDWSLYVPASQSDDSSILLNTENVTLADAYGLALVKHMPALTADVHKTMHRLFADPGGELSFTLPLGPSGYRATNPMLKLSAYAMYAHDQDKDLVAFLRPWGKTIAKTDEAAVCMDMRSKAFSSSKYGEKMTLHAHAVIAQNAEGIKALGACLVDPRAAMLENFSQRAKTHQWIKSTSSLELASRGTSADVVQVMLEQLKAGMDRDTFLEWAAVALETHIENCGLTNNKNLNGHNPDHDLIQWHEDCSPVFDAIMKTGGKEFLCENEDRINTMVMHSTWSATMEEREIAAAARKAVLRAESIAQEAINKSHPEAISACMPIIARTKHFTEDRDKVLDKPLLNMGLNNVNKDKINRQVVDRIMAAFDPNFLQNQIAHHGLALLHVSAKEGNIPLCTALVDLGADPLKKDERGWSAESHFKGDAKSQWRSYLSSRQAMAAVQSIFETLPHASSHP